MRPPRKTQVEYTLDPIDIEGDPERDEYDIDPLADNVITIDPIDIEGRSPTSTSPGGKMIPATWTGRDEEPVSWRIAELLEQVYPDFDNGELPVGKGLGTYRPEAVAGAMSDVFTLRHTDELMGALAAAQGEDYAGTRDRVRDQQERAREEFPTESMVGTGLGIAATLPLFGASAAESTGGRIAQGAFEGLGFGALGAEGASESDLLSGQWAEDVIEGGTEGAVLGGALGAGGEMLRGALGRFAGDPSDRARRAAFQRLRQAGAERAPDLRRLGRQGTPEEVAQDLRDLGIFGESGWASRDAAAGALADAGKSAGRRLGDIREPLADEVVDLADVYEALRSRFDELGTDPTQFASQARNALRSQMSVLEQAFERQGGSTVPFSALDRIRRNAGVSTADAKRVAESGSANASNFLYGLLADLEDAAVERLAPELVAQYRGSMRPHELMKAMGEVSGNAELRDAARSATGLSDYGAAAMGESRGENRLGGLIGWLLNRTMQGREPAIRANWNESMGRLGQSLADGGAGVIDAARRGVLANRAVPSPEPVPMPEPAPPPMAPDEEISDEEAAFLSGETISDEEAAFLSGE